MYTPYHVLIHTMYIYNSFFRNYYCL